MTPLVAPVLCLVTDRRRTTTEARTTDEQLQGLAAWLDRAIDGGIDLIQIRERDLDARRLTTLARGVSQRARGTGTRVLVNDRVDVAAASGAAGVHLRADGPAGDVVRPLLPSGALVGRSLHHPEEAGARAGADYLLFGTVFASGSKPSGWPVAGLGGLQVAVAEQGGTPVLAIGGVTLVNARTCAAAGAAGIAGIGLFLPAAVEAGGGFAAVITALRAAF